MSMSSHLLERAIKEWKSGKTTTARTIFKSIILQDRGNETAWIWYIYSLETDNEKMAELETFLSIFPGHVIGKNALANLKMQETQRIQSKPIAGIPVRKAAPVAARPASALKARSSRHSASAIFPWPLVIVIGVCLIIMSAGIFVSRYVTLQSKYQTLQESNQLLWQDFQQLTREHRSTTDQFLTLQSSYETTSNQLRAVQADYSNLQIEHQALQTSYDTLLFDYNSSVQSYAELKENAIVPPYIYIRGREVHLSFLLPDEQIYRWKVQFEWLEYDFSRGNAERYKIKYDATYPYAILNNRFTGENYKVIDYRKFVDPSGFTTFSQFFYERASSEEDFIKGIWFIVAQLTDYSNELSDTPRYPFETLLAGGGDCEDHAILFASMILAAAPENWDVYLVYMDAYNPTQPQDLNHMIVYIDTGNDTYTVEATGKQEMEPYTNGVEGWYHLLEY